MVQLNRIGLTAAVLTVALTACDDTDVAGVGNGGDAPFTVVFAAEAGTTSAMQSSLRSGDIGLSSATISLDQVESIVLPIGHMEALEEDGAWVDAGSIDQDVDLLNLPADGIEVLDSSLPQGEYEAVRFWLTDDATVTLTEQVRVGRHTFEAGTHTLVIPSADNAGVRLFTDFTIDEDGAVIAVLADGDASVRKIVATGSGVLKMIPVLNVRNEDGDDIGGNDEVEIEGLITGVDGDAGTFTMDRGNRSITVLLTDETELDFDDESFSSWADVVAAVLAGDAVEAEVEGEWESESRDRLVASEVEFEAADDDLEVEGLIRSVDADNRSFTVHEAGEVITVVFDDDTTLEFGEGLTSWADVVAAFDAGTPVEAEASGAWDPDVDNLLIATEVEFELDD